MTETLGVRRPGGTATEVIEVNENGEVVTPEVEFDSFWSISEWSLQRPVLFLENVTSESRRSILQDLSGSEQGSGPSNVKPRLIRLSATALVATVYVREEDVVIGELGKSFVKLSSAAKAAYEVLKWAMSYVCLVYDVPFQRLLETLV